MTNFVIVFSAFTILYFIKQLKKGKQFAFVCL